jgi:methyl-accepting chemotaxis protein
VLTNLVSKVSQVSQLVSGVLQASREQASGVTEITNSMEELKKLATRHLVLSDFTKSNGSDLARESENLLKSVTRLEENVLGDRKAA